MAELIRTSRLIHQYILSEVVNSINSGGDNQKGSSPLNKQTNNITQSIGNVETHVIGKPRFERKKEEMKWKKHRHGKKNRRLFWIIFYMAMFIIFVMLDHH